MRKCTGNNTHEWGPEAIFEVECPSCGSPVEFFKDEITRTCPQCRQNVSNDRKDFGCSRDCSSETENRNICPKFRRSKTEFRRQI